MYDQEHFARIYWIEGIWLNRESYLGMKKISGYAPEGWILYTQEKPSPFFLGAYSEETMQKEAKTEFLNLQKEEYVKHLKMIFSQMFEKTKQIANLYFREFYKKERECVLKNPKKVIKFFNLIRNTMNSFLPYYTQTQPQRFFEVEKMIEKKNNPDLFLLTEVGSQITKVMELRKILLNFTNKIYNSKLNVEEFFKKFPKEKNKLDKNIEDLGFLSWDVYGGKLITRYNVLDELNNIYKNINDALDELNNITKIEQKIEKRKSIEIKDKSYILADAVGELLIHRFNTNTYVLCLVNYLEQFINELSKINNIPNEDIQAYKYDELIGLIENGEKVNSMIIKSRKRGYLLIHNILKSEEYIGENAHKKIGKLLEFRKKSHIKTKFLRGVVASFPDENKPIIEARAFVINSNQNTDIKLKEFNEGDIIVATQTHPAIVPYIKKASGIITDEGGLTCHAAIVSRELGKPSIIGTHLATKIFKTGDKVRMNLSNGSIEKI